MNIPQALTSIELPARYYIKNGVITGASKPEQLQSNLAATGLKLPEDVLAEIEKILGFTRFERHVG